MEHKIKATFRNITNKGAVKQLRLNGEIPAVVYGNNQTPITITLNERAFRHEFTHISESTLIALDIEGTSKTVLIKDFVKNNIRNTITHIDFYEISKGQSLTTHVAIIPKGIASGVRVGGILEHFVHEIEIECLPKDLPEILEVDIESLEVGHAIHVRDLPNFPGVTYQNPEDQVVLHISAPQKASLEPDIEPIEEEKEEE